MADDKRIVMKLCYQGQIRRINLVQRPLSILEVQRAVSQLFPTEKAVELTYTDEDGDKVTVSTDLELEEAYNVATESAKASIIRLNVEAKDVKNLGPHPSGSLLCVSFVDLLDKKQFEEAEKKHNEERLKKEKEDAQRKEEARKREEAEKEQVRKETQRKAEEQEAFRIEKALEESRKKFEEEKRKAREDSKRAAEEAKKVAEAERVRKEELEKAAEEARLKEAQEKKEKERQIYLAQNPAREKGMITLMSMGFESELCWEALVASFDNIDSALDKLMGVC